jgi:polysaccharide biosynthesis transport protein
MSLHQYFLALRARAGVFALLLLATVVIVAVVSVLLPKTYLATVSLLVDQKDEQSLNTGGTPARYRIGYLQTQVDIITSRRVAGEVVRRMKLDQNPSLREAFEKETDGTGSIEAWLTEILLKKLKVDTSQSSVIQIMYAANSPQLATDIANAFAAAYTEVALQLRVEPTREAAVWFDEQLKELRNTLEQRQAKLTAYHKEKGLIPTDDRMDIELARLSELSTQVLQAQNQSYDASTRRSQATDSLKKGSTVEMLPEILAQPFIQQMKAELMRSEAKMTELAGNLGPNHPQYQRARNEHAAMRARLDSEMSKVIGGIDNGARQARAREEELQRALHTQRAQVMRLKESRNEVAVLAREVDSAQKAYDIALQRAVVNKVDSRARQTNLSVLNTATPPLEAARPKLGINLALAVIVGLMLGLSAVYLLESVDRRVRSRGDLESELNAPLLVVLDDIRSKAPPRLLGLGIRSTPALLPRLE